MNWWTQEEIEFLLEHIRLNASAAVEVYFQNFKESDRSPGSVRRKFQRLQELADEEVVDNEVDFPESEPVDSSPQTHISYINEVARQQVSDKTIGTSSSILSMRDVINDWIGALQDSMSGLNYRRASTPVISDNRSLIYVASDVHIGKLTENFNLSVAQERFASIPSMLARRNSPELFDEVVVAFAGDIIEGEDIYPTQAHNIEFPAIEQVMHASDLCATLLKDLENTFNCKTRAICVPGNHGRVSKTAHPRTNWDNILYSILAKVFEGSDVEVELSLDEFGFAEIKETKCLINHKGIKHMGTPAMQLKAAGWSMKHAVQCIIHGHWHEWHISDWMDHVVVGNGCMCGPDSLSREIAKENSAKQGYFTISRDLGPFNFGCLCWE